MIKISRISFIAISLIAILSMTGCANKSDVGFDSDSSKKKRDAKKAEVKQQATKKVEPKVEPKVEVKVEPKIEQHKEEEINVVNNDVVLVDELAYVNVVESNVNGKSVFLRSVHFAFDKFKLSKEMKVITKENYNKIDPLVTENSSLKIKLEGNCDEWGTDEYNYALGLKRAKTIKDKLISDGIDGSKIVLVSFGESNPVCNDKSEQCWKKNRRTDYKLLP